MFLTYSKNDVDADNPSGKKHRQHQQRQPLKNQRAKIDQRIECQQPTHKIGKTTNPKKPNHGVSKKTQNSGTPKNNKKNKGFFTPCFAFAPQNQKSET
jgi:hypothetical protein